MVHASQSCSVGATWCFEPKPFGGNPRVCVLITLDLLSPHGRRHPLSASAWIVRCVRILH